MQGLPSSGTSSGAGTTTLYPSPSHAIVMQSPGYWPLYSHTSRWHLPSMHLSVPHSGSGGWSQSSSVTHSGRSGGGTGTSPEHAIQNAATDSDAPMARMCLLMIVVDLFMSLCLR
ncbi:hypothetical protein BE11_39310 [Sorangium cellulosum]|nr:hypothetical protein BE11_39310 [Sorangium cellulosum]